MDVIHNLINVKSFFNHTFVEKMKLKEAGRPMPDISIEQQCSSRGKTYVRQFNKDIYSKNNWICGCNRKNALFCFVCVLFGGEKSWTITGVTDLNHLSEKVKSHENSKNHLHSEMEFAMLGTADIKTQLNTAYWENIKKFNENVTKNRYIMSLIIDCIKFCGAFELALRGHDESKESDNPDIFQGLINFSAELDKTLADHLKNSTVFKGNSKYVRNDILDCMLEVCHEEILQQISRSPYLAIMADETTDVLMKSQIVIIFRYCQNGEPVERFWTYLVPSKHDAETLTENIVGVLNPILENSPHKLIAQSYDGAAVMSERHTGVQARIKEKYKFAHFIHCYAHELNLIIFRAASFNSQVRVFFGDLQQVPAFFSNSPERVAVLTKIVKRRIPRGLPTRWDFNIRTVNVLFIHKESFIECMEEIENTFENPTVCSSASSIRRMFEDQNFIFWLTFFRRIMPHADILFKQLQIVKIDPLEIEEKVSSFEKSVASIRNSMDDIIKEAYNLNEDALPPIKREHKSNTETDHRAAAIEVCDVIISCVRDRFCFNDHLVLASLFYSQNFAEYNNQFPVEKLASVCSLYPNLDKERLRTELSVIYYKHDCRDITGAVSFLQFLIANNLANVFKETKKLLEMLITTPMTTAETERSFSTLKRVKTFLRNSMREDRLVALSMLSVERKLISNIPNFNEKVIDKFAEKKARRIDLVYKEITSTINKNVTENSNAFHGQSKKNVTENSNAFHDQSKERPLAADGVDQNIKPDPDAISETPFEPVFITTSYELPTVNQSIRLVSANSFPSSNSQNYATPVKNTVRPVALCKVDRTTSLVEDPLRSQLPATSSAISNQSVLPVSEIRPIKLQSSCSEICRTKQKRLVKRLIFARQEIKSLRLIVQKQMKSMGTLKKVVNRLKNEE